MLTIGYHMLASMLAVFVLNLWEASAQPQSFRPPAVPLVTTDPYFSVWSFSNHPAEDWPRHWTGTIQAFSNLVRIDGRSYRLVGRAPQDAAVLPMVKLEVLPTSTIYEFAGGGVNIILTFTTPALPYDLASFSRPVTYVAWQVRSIDGNEHAVSLYFDSTAEIAVDTTDQNVGWSRVQTESLDILRVGSQEQPVLKKSGDNLRIDWGFFYMVSPKEQDARSVIAGRDRVRSLFAREGGLPKSDDLRMPRAARDDWPVLSFSFDLGRVGVQPVERFLLLAYDDQYSIEYFHRRLEPYWRAVGGTTEELIAGAAKDYRSTVERCGQFDRELMADMTKAGGARYARLAALAYRQAVAAHKLTADIDGTPLLFPKENFSNGCIATVDVIYPTAPIFMLFNLDLLKASVTPVLQYSTLKRWRFPFAPHDLGTYPLANGQVYGGGERTEENQMPVEESGNMLILAYAIARAEGKADYALRYWPTLEKWARYLKEKGLDPENQLCTDDFAGHLAHNVNLSLKAILALGSYSKLCAMAGKREEAGEYWGLAQRYAGEWEKMADDGDHYRLAFDKPGTWSQKYNLVWDKILGLDLFPAEIARKEIRYYKSVENKYGLPLDNRKDYTKLDWLVWTATLAEQQSDFEDFISRACDFADQTSNRVPLTDWYDTKTAKQQGFQARSVVGGIFIKMLSSPELWQKWLSRSTR